MNDSSAERLRGWPRAAATRALRRAARLVLPQRARARVPYLTECLRTFGAVRGAVAFYKLYHARSEVVQVAIPQSRTKLAVRTKTSDVATFVHIFIHKDYDIPARAEPKLIIDGGAYVGYASVFFANKYPGAKIIALEPEATNYEMLKANTGAYPNVTALRSAIWDKRTSLAIENPGDEKWAFRVREAGAGAVEALTVDDIIGLSGADFIDILKLDIEGAEREVFSASPAWLDRVGVLIIELHDRYKAGCSQAFYSAVSGHDFREFRRGENVVLVRNRGPRQSPSATPVPA